MRGHVWKRKNYKQKIVKTFELFIESLDFCLSDLFRTVRFVYKQIYIAYNH